MKDDVSVVISFADAERGARDFIDSKMTGKVDRREVRYRAARHPDESCKLCDHYEAVGTDIEGPCARVGGDVGEQMVCDLFEPAGPDDQQGSEPSDQDGEEQEPHGDQ